MKVRERVALGDRIPGFGHSVYKDGDPRAGALLAMLIKGGASRRLAQDAPALITEAIGLRPNADFALAVMMRELGLHDGARNIAVCHRANRRLDCACNRAIGERYDDPAKGQICGATPGRGG